ncbi:condensation domain-containing protein [Streptomyces sp. NPDC057757]|uniref:condensation domain-containing protein n=1 Tax=Streptomyces sp. NPDC057757 TaxID=3346241 RepID=UPI0036A0B95C
MTVPCSRHAAVSVVIDPGPFPHEAPWDLVLRGPLDPAALDQILGEPASGGLQGSHLPGRHRLVRHGPCHHTLRFTAAPGACAADAAGRVADLLTQWAAGRPLAPAQCAVLARAGGDRYEAMFLQPSPAPEADAVRRALHAVTAAHPQLSARPAATGEGRGELLVEGEFTGEADFTAAVAAVGATLGAQPGPRLRALLARDRRPGPATARADRLAVVVHELAADAASWRILLEDLSAALTTPTTPPAPAPAAEAAAVGRAGEGECLADWVTALRELARDPAEVRHWMRVADHRSRTTRTTGNAGDTGTADTVGADPQDPARAPGQAVVPASGPGAAGHTGFALDGRMTGQVTQDLARRLGLTGAQVLTGVFALALARWQGSAEVGFDVCGDPRDGHAGLRRHVGRLTDLYPVQLTLDPALDALGQLAAVAGPLAAGAGRAAGGAGFGACREWSPDPLLRGALRELPPAQACLMLPGSGDPLPASARPVPAGAPDRPAHPLQARLHLTGGRLHLGLHRTPTAVPTAVPDDAGAGAGAGVLTDASVAALGGVLHEVLEELAGACATPIPALFRATAQQTALYTAGGAQPGTGHHVEQLVWVWHGPLDADRFTAAWQSVFDCEAVLRTAFTGGPDPQLMVHSRVTPEITRHLHDGATFSPFLERDRLRGFDLRCPPALRLTLLESERPRPPGAAAPTRIVLTYHRALLDNWSVHLLLREFYRAYLAGGTLPGGERRPDLRDYTAWAAAQDPRAARGLVTGAAPAGDVASSPARPAEPPAATGGVGGAGLRGVGRARLRLEPEETIRLARWAGVWGTAESSVLQAVWAMLIYRACGAGAAAPVRFAVTVPGRGIPLDGVARMPGPLRNPLPMSVRVDPQGSVPDLLRDLRDRALDLAAYEWLPDDAPPAPASAPTPAPAPASGPVLAPSRAAGGNGPPPPPSPQPQLQPVPEVLPRADTVIVFEDAPHPVKGLEGELAAHGIGAEFPGTLPARSVPPIALLAHHDPAGGLTLTAVHDRALLGEEAAAELLVQSALLLRELPLRAGRSTTVGQVLHLLEGRPVPRMAARAAAPGDADTLLTLRAGRQEQAGTICLLPPPGAPAACYDLLARGYEGPQELLVLTATGARALRALTARGNSDAGGGPLLLAGFSGAGALACDLARRLAREGHRPPRTVLAGASADDQERARELARALQDATAPPP